MLPEIKLDTDSFQNLIDEARTMLSGIYSDWTDFNYHDPGMTFIDLFAWLKENQQFYMEQLGPEHYESFFKLLGSEKRGRSAQHVLAQPEKYENRKILSGTGFKVGGLSFETVEDENILEHGFQRAIATYYDNNEQKSEETFFSRIGELFFYPFGEKAAKGSYCTFIFGSPMKMDEMYHLYIQIKEERRRKRNPLKDFKLCPLARLSWYYYTKSGWKNVDIVEDLTENFLFSGRIAFKIHEAMENYEGRGFAIRVVLEESSYDISPVFSGISINQIELVQKKTWRLEDNPLLLGEGNGFPNQEYELPGREVIAESVGLLTEDPMNHRRLKEWRYTRDFSGHKPDEAIFTVDEEKGLVIFGDSFRGLAPEGNIYLTSMEETSGYMGNVKLGTVLTEDNSECKYFVSSEIKKGQDIENTEDSLNRICTGKINKKRAVTARDYEELVKETPGLILHSCKVIKEQSRDNQVTIVVRQGDGRDKKALTAEYKKNILKYLDNKRLIGTTINLLSPEYIEVNLYIELSVMPQYFMAKSMIQSAIEEWFLRIGENFGQALSYGEFYGMLDSLACVRQINSLSLESESVMVTRNLSGDLIPPLCGVFVLKNIDLILLND